ncbi:uncharacterized protein LOC62_03G004749 [Vanrija pseudolonga]|uniref:DUF6534 domain-containing protein n=1 Tax=Vanrija pseudolonga TaxID=143232 RepID=A0AAF0YB88_9TREE|nr:hypothetical protein LOC62_03G004749 [Vanrija pseudolonga]
MDETSAKALVTRGNGNGIVLGPLIMGVIIDAVFLGILLSQFTHWYNQSRLLDRWLVQAGVVFYAERAFKIAGRSRYVVFIVALPIVASVAGALGILVEGLRSNVINTTAATCVADVIITTVVMWGLLHQRSDYEETSKLVKRLLRIACESQLPPTIIALANLIDFAIQGGTYYGVFFEMIQGKIYVIGMLYVLNSRFYINRDMDDGTWAAQTNYQSQFQSAGPFQPPTQQQYSLKSQRTRLNGPATIHVQTETYVESHTIAPMHEIKMEPKLRDASLSGTDSNRTCDVDVGPLSQSVVGLTTNMETEPQPAPKQSWHLNSFAMGMA